MSEETPCPARADRQHCVHWYDGGPCCGCGDPADPAATADYDETIDAPHHHEGRIMTTYHLNLTMAENPPVDVAAPPAARPSRILASLVTEDEKTVAATLRAVADRLDPPKKPGPVWRGGAVALDTPHLRDAEPIDAPMYAHDPECNTLHDGPDPCPPPVTTPDVSVEGASCAGDACSEGHTYVEGCLLMPSGGWSRKERVTPAAAEVVARVDADRRRTRITPDGCGPEHAFTGACALTPPHRD